MDTVFPRTRHVVNAKNLLRDKREPLKERRKVTKRNLSKFSRLPPGFLKRTKSLETEKMEMKGTGRDEMR